jgi:hypothetical protein
MIDKALLDQIDSLPCEDAAQAHAAEWSSRVRALRVRMIELADDAMRLLDAGDIEGAEPLVAQHAKLGAELASLCHRQGEMLSRMRPAPERVQ